MEKNDNIKLRWLNDSPEIPVGVTWGTPWNEGQLHRDEQFILICDDGKNMPIQTWPTAFWPDGSVKWTAHATSLKYGRSKEYELRKGNVAAEIPPIVVHEYEDFLEIDTGVIRCRINNKGSSIIRELYHDQQLICTDGRLISIREEERVTEGTKVIKQQSYSSLIHKVVVEQRGPVRAVVKIEGRHKMDTGPRQWLRFYLRLYFYANQYGIKMVHTFVYDGNPHDDFVKGLGMTFNVPMRGPLYNRHIRLAGDTGFFSESPKSLLTLRTTGKYEVLYKSQTAGQYVTLDPEEDARFQHLIDESAVWDHFKLVQNSSDSYSIMKRTQNVCSWLKAGEGRRAEGMVYAGSECGGVAVGVRDFWKKYPSSIDIEDTSTDEAKLTVWIWSPDAPAMDLRHYDTKTHLESAYEGFRELRSTPYGVGNSSEIYLWCFAQTPDQNRLHEHLSEIKSPSLLICEPEHYHKVRAFGYWSLVDRSAPAKAQIEDCLDAAIEIYKEEIEQRKWYGFWDYGDVMHSYDQVRHTWRYDLGGCAWQNTELVPNMWLWYSFLRTGREDIFRMAEAMTRHTSEVDIYHMGEYAGLGSRHNVIHWGCGCKEARISMAGLHRFYYYITADERIGDIMDAVKDADYATLHLDPMREYFPNDEYPTHARVGPDWAAFSSNWMTRWERFEDEAYRDKLLIGIEDLKRMPYRMSSLATHGYDPKTGNLYYMGGAHNSGSHLAICMGGPQVWMELTLILKDPEWNHMLVEIGEFYNLPREKKMELTNGEISGRGYAWPMFSTGIMAYAAWQKSDKKLAAQAWQILMHDSTMDELEKGSIKLDDSAYIRPIREIPAISTNGVSQWSLNAILCLELIADELPELT